jgi:hypothetical protein
MPVGLLASYSGLGESYGSCQYFSTAIGPKTHRKTSRTPNALLSFLRLIFKIFALHVFWSGVSLAFLQLCPSVFEDFRGEINTVDFSGTDITRYVVVGGKGVD